MHPSSGGTVTVTDQSPSPIVVLNANWGATSLSAIHGVLTSVFEVLVNALDKHPPALIEVGHCPGEHFLAVNHTRPYRMYLSAWNRYWSKYAYQFGNLLSRILTGFDPHQEHPYKWLEDSVCEAASLYALHSISRTWVERPPPAVYRAKEFAPSHAAYATCIEREYAREAPPAIEQSLRQRREGLVSGQRRSELVGIVTCDLLELFRNAPELWQDCGALASCDPQQNETLEEYLDAWSRAARSPRRAMCAPDLIRERLRLY